MTDQAPPTPSATSEAEAAALKRYWRSNVTIMTVLLTIWAIVGLGCGILFADKLNQFQLAGYPLGFWFAQQGSIMTFVLIILTYCILLNRLDKRHHNELEQIGKQSGGAA
jgi:putative solute:sodium symporter small subunit